MENEPKTKPYLNEVANLEHIEWLENQVKKTREELKMTCHNLEMAYPNSESIKQELRFQVR